MMLNNVEGLFNYYSLLVILKNRLLGPVTSVVSDSSPDAEYCLLNVQLLISNGKSGKSIVRCSSHF